MSVCLMLDKQFVKTFSQFFAFTLDMEEKPYPALDLPVYGDSDGANSS